MSQLKMRVSEYLLGLVVRLDPSRPVVLLDNGDWVVTVRGVRVARITHGSVA